ncbi:uncharacterized protein LOC110445589 [Mizuhopecten yessoensis]|uniref:uncharacterized protein LOC110445589 n=1 Tax=Mizuhopecten yessoensis TaxID=6573 RepID=UPI000B4573C7|nr:uncharacterized protein LOC110445589 [Mizuhopecten yessoensis]XP_021345942.1 uncharacterized protein LOC110445589 [Mizuhopecten yessoensis]
MAEGGGVDYKMYFGQLIEILETNPEMKRSAKGISKQEAYGAGGTAIGGVLFRAARALVGGIAGSLIGYISSDDYQRMIQIMINLSDSKKKELVNKVQELVGSVLKDALVQFVTSEENRTALIQLIRSH